MKLRAILLFLAACSAPVHAPVPAPARFRFHVDFWSNLDQSLLHEAFLPRPGYEAPKSLPGHHVITTTTAPIAAAVAWNDAHVTSDKLYEHDDKVAPSLVGLAPDHPPPTGLDDEWRAQLIAAAPDYRAHDWPAHQREGRAYVERIQSIVAPHTAYFVERLTTIYATPFPNGPIDVEIAPVVPQFGGYTRGEPPYTGEHAALITISSEDPDYAVNAGLEMLFHEASHLLSNKVSDAIDESAKRQNRKLPWGLWHDLLFYTVGHVAQERLGPSYVPFAERPSSNLFSANDPSLLALQRTWQPYIDGKTTMAAAIDALVASFPSN